MPWSEEVKRGKLIHIHSTSEFLVVCVNLGQPPNVLFTRSFLEQGCLSLLQSLDVQYPEQKKLLIISYDDTQDGRNLSELLYLRMRREVTSLGWTVEKLRYPVKLAAKDVIWL